MPHRTIQIDDNGGRRMSLDRRQFEYSHHIPERRVGTERRSGMDRRIAAGSSSVKILTGPWISERIVLSGASRASG